MTTEPRNNGHDDTMADDPAPGLDRFARSFRASLPRLSVDAMARVERVVRGELDRMYPAPPQPLPLFTFPRWAAVAAMFVLVVGFSLYVARDPEPPQQPPVATRVVDEFEVVIAPEPSTAQASRWDALFESLDRYASLIGLDRFARR